jgi:hypothetical protein
MAKPKQEYFKPRTQKQIQNISRAINKIDPNLQRKVMGVQYSISDVKMGINDFSYKKNGVVQKVRYDQITSLDRSEQASLINKLSEERYQLRQQRALEIIKEKGKVSKQFKRSLIGQNEKLLENIEEFEQMTEGNVANMIAEEFSESAVVVGDDWFDEADSHFQLTKDGKKSTPELFDFFRPGEAGGFSELNAFTWNTYKVIKGI